MASYTRLPSGWRYRISYKVNGQYKIKSKNGFSTKREAQLAANEEERKLNQGYDFERAENFFPDAFEEWFNVYRKGKNSRDNDNDIRRAVNLAKANFSGVKIKEMNRDDYQRALNTFGENHATPTVKKYHTYMRMFIKECIQEGVIFRDPTWKVIIKGKVKSKDEELKYLNYSEAHKLIIALENNLSFKHMSKYIILFALATGCHFSEIIGLTWDSIDFTNQTVKIDKVWDYKYTNDFNETKTPASKRTITIDEGTTKMLKRIKKEQQEFFLKAGLISQYEKLRNVFVNHRLKMVSNNAVNKCLKHYCKKLGIREITCHSLRHTHASILLYEGVNVKYISRRLGHSDITITLKVYSHIIDELKQRESKHVNDIMNRIRVPNAK
ncbi:site-specific integrase [Listeria ilorinensis]|uniref:site-specific integrase n=1 Tax=Listeria ilorinensis TaxID=2867439 RepID=UPI001EF58BBE|nr:site-specific integrase [Listeria ilorinensis]